MAIVTISGNDYTVYADIASADIYLAGDVLLSSGWLSSTSDQKSAALISSTRYLDQQDWSGEKTDSMQVLAWPRDGAGGDSVDGVIPQSIIDASIILAGQYIVNQSGAIQQHAKQKRLKAGTVEVEFFIGATQQVTQFPASINSLISQYAKKTSTGFSYGVVNSGTCKSEFDGDAFGVYDVNG